MNTELTSSHAQTGRAATDEAGAPPTAALRNVLVSGASGLVGSALQARLLGYGDRVTRLVRRSSSTPGEVPWDPRTGELGSALTGAERVHAVVHLAGENIATGRWTRAKKEAIRESRVVGTRHLAESLARLAEPPEVLVCASAIGIYGDRGDELLTEGSGAGQGFLPEVCQAWEEATRPAREAGVRVVNVRIGVVLATEGGALAKMLTPFRLGLGGRIGDGSQYVSWIHLEDLVSVLTFAIDEPRLEGPVNATAPKPVTNAELTAALGRMLRRPTLFPMPAFAARLALGEMAQDLLLASTRVMPERLHELGFRFEHPGIEGALASLLGGGR